MSTPTGPHSRRLPRRPPIEPEERPAAAIVSLVLYALAGVTLAVTTHLTAPADHHEGLLTGLAVLLVAVAAPVAYTIQRDARTPGWVQHVLQAFVLSAVAVVVALSGGADSPYWFYIFFPALFCSYFYRQPVAAGYLAACVAVHALPFVYGNGIDHPLYVTQFVTAAPAYVALGLSIAAGKRVIAALRTRAETLAREQSALRRVATAVVDGLGATEIYAMVATELAALFGCDGAGILRCQDEAIVVAGAYGEHADSLYREGSVWPVIPGGDADRALRCGAPMRTDRHADGAPMAQAGYLSTVLAPVTVGDRMWGLLAAASPRAGAFTAQDEQTMMEFGALLATAIASAEERAKLAEQALTDSLTGLANSRALHTRLEAELARAGRRGSPLSVAVIDVDHFKEINDNAGHETGDGMLVRLAAALASFARSEDTLGRLGGDEFAWILPDTTREQALVAVERARRLIASAPADPFSITFSAGICDTESTDAPAELIHLADSALYWSKAHGRNQSWIYDPAVIQELTDIERAARLRRAQAVEGLRGLARSIDEREPASREHSERVALVAIKLARVLGYAPEDVVRLGEAARLHELGRLVCAPGQAQSSPLDAEELTRLRAEAGLSARMVADVLDHQQTAWIAGQYEARAREGETVPAGDGLLALADAWDTLTAVRLHAAPEALAVLERHAGERFGSRALDALVDLHRAGELLAGAGEPVA
jgi:diguanylate cyclase (GGDEF)-like protein